MNSLEKAPRWFLLLVSGMLLTVCYLSVSVIVKNAFADIENVKSVASIAKNVADLNQAAVSDLKDTVDEIKASQIEFQKKYDRNQEENQRVFRQILSAVKS